MTEKKRDTTRVEFHTRAELRCGDVQIQGKVENLSLKGMFLVADPVSAGLEKAAAEERVSVIIRLAGVASDLSLSLEGRVVRQEKRGLGIEFTDMEFDTFVHLRNIVTYNAGDDEKIMEEFSETFSED